MRAGNRSDCPNTSGLPGWSRSLRTAPALRSSRTPILPVEDVDGLAPIDYGGAPRKGALWPQAAEVGVIDVLGRQAQKPLGHLFLELAGACSLVRCRGFPAGHFQEV